MATSTLEAARSTSAGVPPSPGRALAPALALLLLAAGFYRASCTPIYHTDTWDHWKYGEWIVQHRQLPAHEPFSPYSEPGQPLVDTMWLSQVAGYLAYTAAGMEGIALFYGLVEVARLGLYLTAFRRLSGSLVLAVVGVVLMEAGRWTYFGVFRPQAVGEVCWAGLLAVLSTQYAVPSTAKRVLRWWQFLLVAPLFAVWANLHGAFVLGLVVLGIVTTGRLFDAARDSRSLGAGLRDRAARRLALLLALATAASCINPYGPRLLAEVLSFGKYPILQSVAEWRPMTPLATYGGKAFVASIALVLLTLRYSPRRFGAADVGLLLAFGLAAWFSARMLPWWMAVCPFVLLPHWAALRAGRATTTIGRGALLACRLVLVAASGVLLLASPTSRWLFTQQPRPVREQVTRTTPVEPARRLLGWMADGPAHPSPRIFASLVWSDYLLWALPPEAQLFLYTHYEVFHPRRMAQRDRLLRRRGPPSDWHSILEREGFDVLALSGDEPLTDLADYLREQAGKPDAEWDILYDGEEPRGVVAVRRGLRRGGPR